MTTGYRTDCVQKPLALLFEKLGYLVGAHPVCFMIIPLLVSAGLGGGFYFLEDHEDNDIERQFTPTSGWSKEARRFVRDNFPHDDSMFSVQRLYTEGNYASVILSSINDSNIFTEAAFQDIINLDSKVKNISVSSNDRHFRYENLCAKMKDKCIPDVILNIIDYDPQKIEHTKINFPLHELKGRPEFLGFTVGGVNLSEGLIQSAQAVRLFYFLEDVGNSNLWLKQFQRLMLSEHSYDEIKVSLFTSLSRQEEFEKHTPDGIPLFSITYSLVISFSVISCLRFDNVRNKVWVAFVGVLSAGLAVISSFGLMLYIGVPFVITVVNAPFLILGIGVDDMFIMVSNWQQTNVKDPVEKRMADTYKEAAMSITITTVTDILGFYIGLMTDFPSVQYFCLYTSTAIFLCYVYNITFFGAFLALNGRRERRNAHWLTCVQIPSETPEDSSRCYSLCCVGGHYNAKQGSEREQPINSFFKRHYGPFLTKRWSKLGVVLLYVGYATLAVYGCFQVQEGINMSNLAADDSYVNEYYADERRYFSRYGPTVMVTVGGEYPYWEEKDRAALRSCVNRFTELSFVSEDVRMSWLDIYEEFSWLMHFSLNNQTIFMSNLSTFFSFAPELSLDVNITDGKIYASRFFVQTVDITNATMEIKMFNELREMAKKCTVADILVFHPAFIFYDQYDILESSTIQSIGFTAVVMLMVSLVLIPNPVCSLWVTLSIGSVITGVTGFMALWDVNLDTISMIILVVCVGFTVDFSAHISYAFVSSEKPSADEKAIDAVFHLGYPVLQGALSTIIGVIALATSKNYIYRTLFKIMFLVMVLGLVHGLMFIPVFLTMFSFNCNNKDKKSYDFEYNVKLDQKAIIYENKVFETENKQCVYTIST
ncbi:patched domain-containing protein 3-like [Alosa pseudoharengus]|uniref:patched domain-containing protein 3-like n=1 Tax=Alosa pseudoharengus TaxID=34774 RepID=UPI003F8C1114